MAAFLLHAGSLFSLRCLSVSIPSPDHKSAMVTYTTHRPGIGHFLFFFIDRSEKILAAGMFEARTYSVPSTGRSRVQGCNLFLNLQYSPTFAVLINGCNN